MKGFTLLELLITTILLAALSTMGLASYTYLIQRNEQQTIIDELKVAVQYAKIQAIISGGTVSLSSGDETSLNWANGMVLTALNKTTHKIEQLYRWQWHHPRWALNWKGAFSAEKITFSNNPTQAISNGRFTLTNTQTNQQKVLILNRLGRLRVIA